MTAPNPGEVAERERLRAEVERLRVRVADLEAENVRLRGPAGDGGPEPPGLTWEHYNR